MTLSTGVKLRWSPEEDQAIRDGYAAGKLASEVAAQIGRNKNQVLGRAFRIGAKSSLQGSAGSKRWQELNAASAAGSTTQPSHYADVLRWAESHPFGSQSECAAALGLSKTTVRKHAQRIRAEHPA